MQQIARSIERFGFVNPILIDEHNEIIAGHGRFEALKRLKWKEAAVIQLSHLSADKKRALALVDNQIPLNAEWNAEALQREYEYLLKLPALGIAEIGLEEWLPMSTFVDDIADGSGATDDADSRSQLAAGGERSDFVVLQFSMTQDQRALVISWLKDVSAEKKIETTGEVLVHLARQYKKGVKS